MFAVCEGVGNAQYDLLEFDITTKIIPEEVVTRWLSNFSGASYMLYMRDCKDRFVTPGRRGYSYKSFLHGFIRICCAKHEKVFRFGVIEFGDVRIVTNMRMSASVQRQYPTMNVW